MHGRCTNPNCRCIGETNDYNELYWFGSSPENFIPGPSSEAVGKCKLVCRYCKVTFSCLEVCHSKLFYAMSKDPLMSRACIHFGIHKHPVAKGDC